MLEKHQSHQNWAISLLGCRSRVPQTKWLNATEIYPLIVWGLTSEVKVLAAHGPSVSGWNPSLPLPSFQW